MIVRTALWFHIVEFHALADTTSCENAKLLNGYLRMEFRLLAQHLSGAEFWMTCLSLLLQLQLEWLYHYHLNPWILLVGRGKGFSYCRAFQIYIFFKTEIYKSWTRCPTIKLTDALKKYNFKKLAVQKDARVYRIFFCNCWFHIKYLCSRNHVQDWNRG